MLYPSVAGRQNYNSQNSLGFGSLRYAPVRFQGRRCHCQRWGMEGRGMVVVVGVDG